MIFLSWGSSADRLVSCAVNHFFHRWGGRHLKSYESFMQVLNFHASIHRNGIDRFKLFVRDEIEIVHQSFGL